MIIYFVVAIGVVVAIALLRKKKSKTLDSADGSSAESSVLCSSVNMSEKSYSPHSPQVSVVETVTEIPEIPVYWFENDVRKEGTAKVAQGLQVFDANGKYTVDITDRLTKYLGKFRTYASQNEGIVVDERLTADGDLWYMSVQRYGQSFNPEWNHSVLVTKEIGQLRWRYPQNTGIRYDFDIIYGVY